MGVKFSYKSTFTAIIGDVFTLYNFAVFGYLAPIIGQIFFPTSKPLLAITKIFLLYAVGYVFRPLGGIILSHVGDKYGRRIALLIAFFTIALTSFAMGLLPAYERIGYCSTLLLVFLRIMQGLAAGGELSNASAYIHELAQKRKGFWVSWNSTGALFGVLLGSLVVVILSIILTNQKLVDFGWRIPFLFGAVLIVPGILALKFLPESEDFKKIVKSKAIERIPIVVVFKKHWINMLAVFLFAATTAVVPLVFVWTPIYVSTYLGKATPFSSITNTITLFVLVSLMPIAGWVSDKIGYLKLASASTLLMLLFSTPLFYLIINKGQLGLLISQLIFAVIFSNTAAVTSILMTSQFPTQVRCSGIAISYNAANLLFGGTAPVFCAFLVGATKMKMAPAYYLAFCMLVSLCGCFIIKVQKRKLLCKE